MKKHYFISLITLLLTLSLIFDLKSQTVNNLKTDSLFFLEQQVNYQKWLTEIGLNKVLSMSNLTIDTHKIKLKLTFNYTAEDSATWAWKQLCREYEAANSLTLTEALFLKLSNIMELDFNQITILIRNNYKSGQLPTIDEFIFYDVFAKKIVVEGDFRTEVRDSIDIPSFRLPKQFNRHDILFQVMDKPKDFNDYMSEKLFEKFKAHFLTKTEEQFIKPQGNNPFTIKVFNLKSVVVPSSQFDFFDPREFLTFEVKIVKNKNDININYIIDGKYGSGLFIPRSRESRYGHMSPKYAGELETYNKAFKFILRDWVIEILNKK